VPQAEQFAHLIQELSGRFLRRVHFRLWGLGMCGNLPASESESGQILLPKTPTLGEGADDPDPHRADSMPDWATLNRSSSGSS
jgi:hypothetical protein